MHDYSQDLAALFSLKGLFTLFTLSVLEIVLGFDNIIFISITADKLPRHRQQKARTIGLSLALIVRSLLLFSVGWLAHLEKPFFQISDYGVSGRALVLLAGGLFLLIKTWKEIQEKIKSGGEDEINESKKKKNTFANIVFQIIIIDIVFSFDSIITAVALSNNVFIMVAAVTIAMILMILFSGLVADFINRNQGIKMIALSFLLFIGGILVAEAGIDIYNTTVLVSERAHINKNYAYVALGFAVLIELFNMRERKEKRKKDFNPDD